MSLIKSTIVTYTVDVPEVDVRQALIFEAADRHGLTHEGKIIKGVEGNVTFDGRRGSNGGTYTVHLRRNVAMSDQAQLPKPGADE